MNIMVVHLDSLFPPAHGGAHLFAELCVGLSSIGNNVQVMQLFEAEDGMSSQAHQAAQTLSKLENAGVKYQVNASGTVKFSIKNVLVKGCFRHTDRFLNLVSTELRLSTPDIVILSDAGGEDAHTVLKIVHGNFFGKIIYYPMTLHMLPFGAAALIQDEIALDIIRHCQVLAPSKFAAEYIESALNKHVDYCLPPIFDVPLRANANRFGEIRLLNPSSWKGLPILLEIAKERPDYCFGAKVSWATKSSDLVEISKFKNIKIISNAQDKTDFYLSSSIVLCPSLCLETLGIVCIEAMLHGVPVLASNYGGMREAKLGVPYSLPIRPITFSRDGSEKIPNEYVPEQSIEPWLNALDTLLGNESHYEDISKQSRAVSREFVESLSWDEVSRVINL